MSDDDFNTLIAIQSERDLHKTHVHALQKHCEDLRANLDLTRRQLDCDELSLIRAMKENDALRAKLDASELACDAFKEIMNAEVHAAWRRGMSDARALAEEMALRNDSAADVRDCIAINLMRTEADK